MPRLLIVCEYPTLNGGERSMLATVDGVRAAGYEPFVACPPEGPLAEAVHRRRLPVLPFTLHDSGGRRLSLEALRTQLAAVVERAAPDLLHANSLSMTRLAGPLVAAGRVPGIGHLRDIVRLSASAIADINAQRRLLAVSQATRAYHVQAGVAAAKAYVLYNGVSLDEFQPRPPTQRLHSELRLPPRSRLAISIGQIGIRKGLDILLQAAARVVAAMPDVHFVVVGQRHSGKEEAVRYERELQRMAAEPPRAGHIHFLGRRTDVPVLLNEAAMLVHAARQEPCGRVLLEAAASGTPVVATDVGGTREVFGPAARGLGDMGGGAILVPSERPDALAEAVLRIARSTRLARRLAVAGRQRAVARWDARRATEGLLRHYREVLAGG